MRPTGMLSSSRWGSNVDGQGGAAAAVRVSARDGGVAFVEAIEASRSCGQNGRAGIRD